MHLPSTSSASVAGTRIIRLDDRRAMAANVSDLGTNAIAAFGVLSAASGALPVTTTAGAIIAAAEAVAGIALLVAIVGELREMRAGVDDDAGKIAWVTLFAAVVLIAECVQSYHDKGRVSRPTAVSAVATLVLAFFSPRLKQRRAERQVLRLDAEGMFIRRGRLRRFSAAWSEIAAIRRDGAALHIHLRDGRTRTLRLRTIRNRDEVFAALSEAAVERGIPSAAPAPLPAR
ncbi:MAG TPA: hypothetical protein VF710_00850 [Longimicrobium sp.]|jgi:hypothetical protein